MKIGELASRTGTSVRMLRYYEAEGLLAPRRTESGYREYDDDTVEIVDRVKLLGAVGVTLPVVRHFLPCLRKTGAPFEPCEELRSLLREQIRLVDGKIDKLNGSRALLTRFLTEMCEVDAGHSAASKSI